MPCSARDLPRPWCFHPAFKSLRLADADPDDLASLPGWREHLDQLTAAMDFAVAVGCPRVRLFTGRRDVGGDNPSPRLPDGGGLPAARLDAIRAILLDAARRAEDLGLTLCVENVRSCFGNTGRNTAAILAAVDHPSVRTIWDPANDFVSGGDDFRAGYEAVKPWMVHVHAKDATVVDRVHGAHGLDGHRPGRPRLAGPDSRAAGRRLCRPHQPGNALAP